MKKVHEINFFIAIMSVFLIITSNVYCQTSGNLSFSCATAAPSGSWGNKHVLAIWIENTQNPSAFIKTNAKYGNDVDHLTSWGSKTGKNTTDAVTGATLSSYGTRTIIWDGTNVNKVVVADGTYKVFIEMGWGKDKIVQHSVLSFSFEKGPAAVHLTPAGNANYSNVIIDWAPLTTLIKNDKYNNFFSVYPNPTNGILNLDFHQKIPSARVDIENSIGAVVYSNKPEEGFTGKLNMDMSSMSNGIYFLRVTSPDMQYIYKIILQH